MPPTRCTRRARLGAVQLPETTGKAVTSGASLPAPPRAPRDESRSGVRAQAMLLQPGMLTDTLAKGQRPNEQVLDKVYRTFAPSDPFLPIHDFVNHTTMGSEALVALGLGRDVEGWVRRHGVRVYAPPRTGISLHAAWKEALGRRECHGDWLSFFEGEVASSPFQDVLAQWAPRFAHAVDALLFHGLIRTAHAVRALSHQDTPARRGELARGLALWAIGIRRPAPDATAGDRAQPHFASLDILRYAQAGAAAFVEDPTIPNLHLVTGPMAYLLIFDRLDPAVHPVAAAAFESDARDGVEWARAPRSKRAVGTASGGGLQAPRLPAETGRRAPHQAHGSSAAGVRGHERRDLHPSHRQGPTTARRLSPARHRESGASTRGMTRRRCQRAPITCALAVLGVLLTTEASADESPNAYGY